MEFKRWDLVDEHELKLMALRCFLIEIFNAVVLSIGIYLLMKNIVDAEFTFIGCFFGAIYFSLIILKRDWLDEKIGLFDPDFLGFSYQGIVVLLVYPSICLSYFLPWLGTWEDFIQALLLVCV